MKQKLPAFLRGFICSVALLFMHISSFASHIVGADLKYQWVSGNTYQVTCILYGNCGTTTGAFETLCITHPQICIFNGGTYYTTIACTLNAPVCGQEITPVCPSDTALTQCTNTSFTIPGIKQFVYTGTVTLPTTSHHWRFVYTADDGTGEYHETCYTGSPLGTASAAGRASTITNLTYPSSIQLIDTLNNADTGLFSHNTSPDLTVVPTPFFCLNNTNCYNPGAVDPDGDSLRFALTAPGAGSGGAGSAAACTVGGPVAYRAGVYAWGTTPVAAATPLQCTMASFLFDPATGQICFYPTVLQRSVVVYNIEEYREDTLIGTSQREMTFLVLTCTNASPISGLGGLSGVIPDTAGGVQLYHTCGNSGPFCLTFDTSSADTNLITYTVTGLATSMTYTVVNNGTRNPVLTVCGNTDSLTPGLYVFYVHMQDNGCPLVGTNTQAISINLYPVPTLRDSIIAPANCFHGEIIEVIPGGTGHPWLINAYTGPLDTFQAFANDSVSFIDTLNPNGIDTAFDSLVIYTDVSSECNVHYGIKIAPPPPIDPSADTTNPSYCGATDGVITLTELFPGITDTVRYKFDSVWHILVATVTADSTIAITGLLAGTYDSIYVTYGFCKSQYLGPFQLTNPPFPIRTFSYINPSHCGYCDGSITLYGLNPNQLDSIYYTLNGVNKYISYFVGPDSTVVFQDLCDDSSYTSFYARTDSVCVTGILPGVTMNAPKIQDTFSYVIHYGCNGDTVIFTNHNYSTVDTSDLSFHWYFGDGSTDTAQNATHIYYNTESDTSFNVKLYMTNGECLDSFLTTIKLVNYISGSYTIVPYPYVCQGVPVNFTNTSVSLGTGPGNIATTYSWTFGDGNTSALFSPTNTYLHTGTYNITMIQTNFVPCSDTVIQSITVDTISGMTLVATDTVLCSGQQVMFTGLYASEGNTNTLWSITDGFSMDGINPVLHSFDGAGTYVVSVTATYRACPSASSSRTITVYGYADLYLGPDTSICPGSTSIVLADNRNSGNPGASWLWSNGETGPQITVTKPGYYSVAVTINGCSTSDTVWVQNDCYMDIPNAFTPNGDGVNDYFYPRQMLTRGMTTFSMNIYNRWGQLIYQTTSIDGRGWDGNFNNIQQPEGVYVYIIDATFQDGQTEHHQGNVTLLR